ncbi:MAG: SAM-dependent methyltransferase [Phenylobacterium sp.]|jgi:SAM-dependent methyltransferase
MSDSNISNRNQYWQSIWADTVQAASPFATMGRRSYSIADYFIYVADIVAGLGGVKSSDRLLDGAGGCGYISMYFAPLVHHIDLFDYSTEAIAKAVEETKNFSNINAYEDNLLTLENTLVQSNGLLYDKVLIGGALQYFDGYDEIKQILQKIYQVTANNGRVFVTHSADIKRKQAHIDSYQRLDWTQVEKDKAIADELTHRLWLDFDEIKNIATEIGFSDCQSVVINSQLFQSTHSFDFFLMK